MRIEKNILLLLAMSLGAQDTSFVRWVQPDQAGTSPADFFSKSAITGPAIAGSAAKLQSEQLAKSSLACAAQILTDLAPGAAQEIQTVRAAEGDAVIAKFRCDAQAASCVTEARDLSGHNEYEVRLGGGGGESDDDLAGRLFRRNASPLMLKGVILSRLPDGVIAGYGDVVTSPTRSVFGISMMIDLRTEPGILRIAVGKGHCGQHYSPDQMFVARRFPPLSQEAAGWSRERLTAEAVDEIRKASLGWEKNRLLIVLGLLGDKGASAQELERICTAASDIGRDLHAVGLGFLIQTWGNEPRLKEVAPNALRACLASLPLEPAAARDSAVRRFLSLSTARREFDFSELARQWLRERRTSTDGARMTTRAAFRYLAGRAETAPQAQELIQMSVDLALGEGVAEEVRSLKQKFPEEKR